MFEFALYYCGRNMGKDVWVDLVMQSCKRRDGYGFRCEV